MDLSWISEYGMNHLRFSVILAAHILGMSVIEILQKEVYWVLAWMGALEIFKKRPQQPDAIEKLLDLKGRMMYAQR